MKVLKLYFYIKNSTLVPYARQSKDLDNIFKKDVVLESNRKNYNEYTKTFIKNNTKNSSIYYSEDYSYNAKKRAFNFNNLTECDSEEYMNLLNIKDNSVDFNINEDINTESIKETFYMSLLKETPCPELNECKFYINKSYWNLIIRNIKRHKNTMITGPTGTGKTEIIKKICELLNIPISIYDMGSMQDPLTDLLGSHRLENGSSVFDYAKFTEDIQKPGVILLDELSRAPQQATNILFPCLDNRRQLPIEIADSKSNRVIKVHPECVFIATANIGDEYSGTEMIDAALLNRFMTIKLDYLPVLEEIKLLKTLTEIPDNIAERLVEIANIVRAKYSDQQISMPISTRETIECAELISDGFPIMDAYNFAFVQKYQSREEEQLIRTIIMGY